jgi:nucleoside-diphosphate-sugar epimerase
VKVEPWTYIAKFKRQVEEELHNIPGLNFTVVRPAIVYGIGDRHGLGRFLAYFQKMKEGLPNQQCICLSVPR